MIELEQRIEEEYHRLGYDLGWRFLYSPVGTLHGAKVAFIGLNPGGREKRLDHASFAMPEGYSAYRDEAWSHTKGQSVLQKQVLGLFDKLAQRPEDVLSGNLVPFRSQSWKQLQRRTEALRFGQQLWSSVLKVAKPELVVTMGADVRKALSPCAEKRVPLGWGNVCGSVAVDDLGVTHVSLPHLSRFSVMQRPASRPGLKTLFGEYWNDR